MDLPLNLLAESIVEPSVCLFRNVNHTEAKFPHYHIVIPSKENDFLVLCHITKQVENRVWYYRRIGKTEAINCLVKVDGSVFDFLTTESVIECNQAEITHKKAFASIVHPLQGCQIITRSIPIELEKKIREAILQSPVVKLFIKNAL
jgi:hypothetical protein